MAARALAAISLVLVAGIAGFWRGRLFPPAVVLDAGGTGGGGLQAARVIRLPDERPDEREAPLPSDLLSRLALPPDLVRDDQWAKVDGTLQEAVTILSRAYASDVQRVETLRDWLSAQGCVERVNAPIREGGHVGAVLMLTAYPALVPITIVFRGDHERRTSSRLLLSVGTTDGLTYVSLKRGQR